MHAMMQRGGKGTFWRCSTQGGSTELGRAANAPDNGDLTATPKFREIC